MLRRQIGRISYQSGRPWPVSPARRIPRRRQGQVPAATPATLPARHAGWSPANRTTPASRVRSATCRTAISKLVIRIATGDPAWGTAACEANSPGSATRSLPRRVTDPHDARLGPEAVPDRAGPRGCPQVRQSGGKRKGSNASGRGNPYLSAALGEISISAGRTQSFLGARYRRLVKRMPNRKPSSPPATPS
jgi:hypothetical protein